ncbi:MAG: hypothetical protein ACR65U_04020 [Methylocystis sp.]
MTEQGQPLAPRKKTPSDASDFEREQLRFFLSGDDLATTLATVNPSLAWLPVLSQMKLIQGENQLIAWIERNFADVDAVRDVVANIRFFGPETANFLEYRLNMQAGSLSTLLMQCWRLIIRHMKTAKPGLLQSEWFEIAPQVSRGENSPALLARIAEVLRPKLTLSKRPSLYDKAREFPEHPFDLISIEYEVEADLSADEVLKVWPENATAETDSRLLSQLTAALSAVLDDATDVGVEGNKGYSMSDTDVPSVARHDQNSYRSGFHAIVRVMAEIWLRLARKSPQLALPFVQKWRDSDFRLLRRLALFACADPVVSNDFAADMLIELPNGELFLTNSSVEVYRLIRTRWNEFAADKQQVILGRLREGPPRDWFREDAEIDRAVDRSRFDILAGMERDRFDIGEEAGDLLKEIGAREPTWRPRPAEQIGFHIWQESNTSHIAGDADKLRGVPDDQLVAEAKKIAAATDFLDGDNWQALCLRDPDRALRGLKEAAVAGDWTVELWEQLLWARKEYVDADTERRVALLLMQWPPESFSNIAGPASSWIEDHANTLDEALLWPLWDRIADASLVETEETNDADVFADALNAPPGRLAEIMLRKLTKGSGASELPDDMRKRLDKLVDAPGKSGKLARIRLAAEVAYLFERAPAWTKENIIPLFQWSSPDAAAAWSARKYSTYIGSPELFSLTKQAFLDLFSRMDLPDEDLRVFADWLGAIMLANQSGGAEYSLTATEARSALRRAGVRSLPNFGHRLAIELEKAKPDEKISKWETLVGPVFQTVWPLDVDLQTSDSTFKLVQILRAAGNAFPEAADVIVPFVRPDDPRHHTSVFSISEADDVLYSSSPERILDLLAAVVGDPPTRSAFGLGKALDRVRTHAPELANTRKFQKLLSFANNS